MNLRIQDDEYYIQIPVFSIGIGARHYDPLTRRFTTPDPMGMIDGPNIYLYCNNDPVNGIDVWGELCTTDIKKILEKYLPKIKEALKKGNIKKLKELLKQLAKDADVNLTFTGVGSFTGTVGLGYLLNINIDVYGNIDAIVGIGLGVSRGFSFTLSISKGDAGSLTINITASGGKQAGGFISGSHGSKGNSISGGFGVGVGQGIAITGTYKIRLGQWKYWE